MLRFRYSLIAIVSLIAFVAGVFALAPKPHPKRALYYWKTQWSASPEILRSLEKNQISQLYMRFFDVAWDAAKRSPYPVSSLQFESSLPRNVEIVPVVYIVNNVFLQMPYEDVE